MRSQTPCQSWSLPMTSPVTTSVKHQTSMMLIWPCNNSNWKFAHSSKSWGSAHRCRYWQVYIHARRALFAWVCWWLSIRTASPHKHKKNQARKKTKDDQWNARVCTSLFADVCWQQTSLCLQQPAVASGGMADGFLCDIMLGSNRLNKLAYWHKYIAIHENKGTTTFKQKVSR